MVGGFSVGRIFGIKITIDWSWIFIFVLVTWNVGTAMYVLHPGWGPVLSWGLAILAALLFFASVLTHELAHSVVARAQGLPVRNITLFLFGGVSNIQQEPHSPGQEFVMAIVGPLTSIVLGIIFWVIGAATAGTLGSVAGNPAPRVSALSPISSVFLWLGPINLLLGVFNLIPGFPLDGGRVLRSILWAATRNLRTATRWASWVGETIAWVFIVAGVATIFGFRIPIFGTDVVSGIWLAFIGWFLYSAARQSYRQVVIRDVLEDVPVSRLMRTDVPTVPATTTIGDLVNNYVMRTDARSFPVFDDGHRLVGLVCLDDVRKVPREAWDTTTVRQIMTPLEKLEVVTPQEDANDAFTVLAGRDVDQVPVVQDGQLAGMLRRGDVLRWLQTHADAAA